MLTRSFSSTRHTFRACASLLKQTSIVGKMASVASAVFDTRTAAKYDRAQTQVALGLKLAQVQGLLEAHSGTNTFQSTPTVESGIVWTLFMLDKITGTGYQVKGDLSAMSCVFRLPLYQGSSTGPGGGSRAPRLFGPCDTTTASSFSSYNSITAVMIELLDIWGDVTSTILQRKPRDETPFWQDNSSRARIQARMLEIELSQSIYQYRHRLGEALKAHRDEISHLSCNRFTIPGASRAAFAELLFRQILLTYPSYRDPLLHVSSRANLRLKMTSTRNHPFIIFIGTERSSGHVPWSFLQNSYKVSTVNANWIARLVIEMSKAGLSLQNPFIGYLVTIAATIHLEKSLDANSDVANPARHRYETCYQFVKNLSNVWPAMSNSVSLETLPTGAV